MGFMFDEGFMGGIGQPSPAAAGMFTQAESITSPVLGGQGQLIDELIRRAQAEGVPVAPAQSEVGSVVGGGLFGVPTVVLPAPEGAVPDRPGMLSAAGIASNPMAAAAMTGARGRSPGGLPPPGPTGPIQMDPSQIEFAGQQVQPGQPGGRGALGMSLKIPGGVSTKPLTSAVEGIKGMRGRPEEMANETMTNLQQASSKARRALEDEAYAKGQAADAVAGAIRSGLEEAEQVARDRQERIAKAQGRVTEKLGAWEQARQDYQTSEVDPQRRFSGGSKVGAAIAMALGAYGAALTGGQNTAMQIIQSEIDRDIAAQRANIGKKKEAARMLGNELQTARQIFGDEKAAEVAAKQAVWDKAKRLIEIERQKYVSPIAQAQADKAIAGIEQKQAELGANVQAKAMDQELRIGSAEVQGRRAEIAAKQTNQKLRQSKVAMQAKANAAKAYTSPAPGLVILDPNSPPPDKASMKEVRKIAGGFNDADRLFKELIKWRAKYGSETIPGPAKAKGRALAASLTMALANALGRGANFTEMERDLLNIPEDPGEYGFVLDRLQQMHENTRNSVAGKLQPYNIGLKSMQARAKGRRVQQR